MLPACLISISIRSLQPIIIIISVKNIREDAVTTSKNDTDTRCSSCIAAVAIAIAVTNAW